MISSCPEPLGRKLQETEILLEFCVFVVKIGVACFYLSVLNQMQAGRSQKGKNESKRDTIALAFIGDVSQSYKTTDTKSLGFHKLSHCQIE